MSVGRPLTNYETFTSGAVAGKAGAIAVNLMKKSSSGIGGHLLLKIALLIGIKNAINAQCFAGPFSGSRGQIFLSLQLASSDDLYRLFGEACEGPGISFSQLVDTFFVYPSDNSAGATGPIFSGSVYKPTTSSTTLTDVGFFQAIMNPVNIDDSLTAGSGSIVASQSSGPVTVANNQYASGKVTTAGSSNYLGALEESNVIGQNKGQNHPLPSNHAAARSKKGMESISRHLGKYLNETDFGASLASQSISIGAGLDMGADGILTSGSGSNVQLRTNYGCAHVQSGLAGITGFTAGSGLLPLYIVDDGKIGVSIASATGGAGSVQFITAATVLGPGLGKTDAFNTTTMTGRSKTIKFNLGTAEANAATAYNDALDIQQYVPEPNVAAQALSGGVLAMEVGASGELDAIYLYSAVTTASTSAFSGTLTFNTTSPYFDNAMVLTIGGITGAVTPTHPGMIRSSEAYIVRHNQNGTAHKDDAPTEAEVIAATLRNASPLTKISLKHKLSDLSSAEGGPEFAADLEKSVFTSLHNGDIDAFLTSSKGLNWDYVSPNFVDNNGYIVAAATLVTTLRNLDITATQIAASTNLKASLGLQQTGMASTYMHELVNRHEEFSFSTSDLMFIFKTKTARTLTTQTNYNATYQKQAKHIIEVLNKKIRSFDELLDFYTSVLNEGGSTATNFSDQLGSLNQDSGSFPELAGTIDNRIKSKALLTFAAIPSADNTTATESGFHKIVMSFALSRYTDEWLRTLGGFIKVTGDVEVGKTNRYTDWEVKSCDSRLATSDSFVASFFGNLHQLFSVPVAHALGSKSQSIYGHEFSYLADVFPTSLNYTGGLTYLKAFKRFWEVYYDGEKHPMTGELRPEWSKISPYYKYWITEGTSISGVTNANEQLQTSSGITSVNNQTVGNASYGLTPTWESNVTNSITKGSSEMTPFSITPQDNQEFVSMSYNVATQNQIVSDNNTKLLLFMMSSEELLTLDGWFGNRGQGLTIPSIPAPVMNAENKSLLTAVQAILSFISSNDKEDIKFSPPTITFDNVDELSSDAVTTVLSGQAAVSTHGGATSALTFNNLVDLSQQSPPYREIAKSVLETGTYGFAQKRQYISNYFQLINPGYFGSAASPWTGSSKRELIAFTTGFLPIFKEYPTEAWAVASTELTNLNATAGLNAKKTLLSMMNELNEEDLEKVMKRIKADTPKFSTSEKFSQKNTLGITWTMFVFSSATGISFTSGNAGLKQPIAEGLVPY